MDKKYKVVCDSHAPFEEGFDTLEEARRAYDETLSELESCRDPGRDSWDLNLSEDGRVLKEES